MKQKKIIIRGKEFKSTILKKFMWKRNPYNKYNDYSFKNQILTLKKTLEKYVQSNDESLSKLKILWMFI